MWNVCRPEDRASLQNPLDPAWEASCKSYIAAVECPYQIRREQIDWLLTRAIHSKFTSNPNYKKYSGPKSSSIKPAIPAEFQSSLKRLAEALQVQVHEESAEVTLEACKIVVESLVTTKDSLENNKQKMMNKKVLPLGFDTGDATMNEAGMNG